MSSHCHFVPHALPLLQAWIAAWIIHRCMARVSPTTVGMDLTDVVDYITAGLAASVLATVPLIIVGGIAYAVVSGVVCGTGRCGTLTLVSYEVIVVLAALLLAYGAEGARLVILRCHCHYRAQVPEEPVHRAAVTWTKMWSMAVGLAMCGFFATVSAANTITDGSVEMAGALALWVVTTILMEFSAAVSTSLRLALRDSQAAYWISTNLAFGIEAPPEACGVFTLSEEKVLARAVTFAALSANARRNGQDEKQMKVLANRALGSVLSWAALMGPATFLRFIIIFLTTALYVGLAPSLATFRLDGPTLLVSVIPALLVAALSAAVAVRDWCLHSEDVARGSHQLALLGWFWCPNCKISGGGSTGGGSRRGDASSLMLVLGGGGGAGAGTALAATAEEGVLLTAGGGAGTGGSAAGTGLGPASAVPLLGGAAKPRYSGLATGGGGYGTGGEVATGGGGDYKLHDV